MHYEQVLFEICLFHYEISSQYPCLYCLSWVLVVLIILIWRLLIMFFTKTASSQSDFCQIVVILVCTTKLIFLRNLCACGNTFTIYTIQLYTASRNRTESAPQWSRSALKLWNSLPNSNKSANSLPAFKKRTGRSFL